MEPPATSKEVPNEEVADPKDVAVRGLQVTGLDIYKIMPDETTGERAGELMAQMNADVPQGGTNLKYGDEEALHLQFWPGQPDAPLILYVHGGSWQVGTHLDSIGSAKVSHLTGRGYAFASVNFTLIPKVTVRQQIQEIAKAIAYLVKQSSTLGYDGQRIVLMGHSSGAFNVALLGTDAEYLRQEGLSIDIIHAVIALDGSNYNPTAELIDSPGVIAKNMLVGLGNDYEHLNAMSAVRHAGLPNARAFLFLHVQRHGDIRQAIELVNILRAVGTQADLHVFEGEFFEGHIQMLLRLGLADYPATSVMDRWLEEHVPLRNQSVAK